MFFIKALLIAAFFSANHASATKTVDIEVTNTLSNIMNVYDNCPSEVAALETCNDGHGAFTSCADCAWTDLLDGTESSSCGDLQSQAAGDYSSCTSCLNECEDELNALLLCAVDLYCGGVGEQPVPVSKGLMC